MTESTQTTTRRTLAEGLVTLEVKTEQGPDHVGTRYAISVGPAGSKSNTRLELSEENWLTLRALIAQV